MVGNGYSIVIVGSGAGGHACAQALRRNGFTGGVRLINGEAGPAINRTLVDTAVLPGLLTEEQISLPTIPEVEVINGRAKALRDTDLTVELEGGHKIQGNAVVVASGSRPCILGPEVKIEDDIPRHHIYEVMDAQALLADVPNAEGSRIVIVGGGFIGTEVASYYASAGASVALISRSASPLKNIVGSDIAARLATLQSKHVEAKYGTSVRSIKRDEGGVSLALSDGSHVSGDALVIAVGTEPASEWLGVPGGLDVDDHLRVTGRSGVYAAGSVASVSSAGRIDHWDAATAQGKQVAASVLYDLGLAEDPGPYRVTTGFTLMAYGAVISARGVRISVGEERAATPAGFNEGGVLTEFVGSCGELTGVAGWNAGAAVVRAAEGIVR